MSTTIEDPGTWEQATLKSWGGLAAVKALFNQ